MSRSVKDSVSERVGVNVVRVGRDPQGAGLDIHVEDLLDRRDSVTALPPPDGRAHDQWTLSGIGVVPETGA